MLRVVFLIMIAITFLSCDYLTDDTETEADTFPVGPTLDCSKLLQDRGNWELLATLKRDVRQDFWHEFYLEPNTEALILQTLLDGKEFLFLIEHPDKSFSRPVQFYFAQPEGLATYTDAKGFTRADHVDLYYPSPPTWYTHWGPETNAIGGQIRREQSGFVANFFAGFPGAKFQHEDNRDKAFVGGSVEFRATREAGIDTAYKPHIKQGFVLKIFAR